MRSACSFDSARKTFISRTSPTRAVSATTIALESVSSQYGQVRKPASTSTYFAAGFSRFPASLIAIPIASSSDLTSRIIHADSNHYIIVRHYFHLPDIPVHMLAYIHPPGQHCRGMSLPHCEKCNRADMLGQSRMSRTSSSSNASCPAGMEFFRMGCEHHVCAGNRCILGRHTGSRVPRSVTSSGHSLRRLQRSHLPFQYVIDQMLRLRVQALISSSDNNNNVPCFEITGARCGASHSQGYTQSPPRQRVTFVILADRSPTVEKIPENQRIPCFSTAPAMLPVPGWWMH